MSKGNSLLPLAFAFFFFPSSFTFAPITFFNRKDLLYYFYFMKILFALFFTYMTICSYNFDNIMSLIFLIKLNFCQID